MSVERLARAAKAAGFAMATPEDGHVSHAHSQPDRRPWRATDNRSIERRSEQPAAAPRASAWRDVFAYFSFRQPAV